MPSSLTNAFSILIELDVGGAFLPSNVSLQQLISDLISNGMARNVRVAMVPGSEANTTSLVVTLEAPLGPDGETEQSTKALLIAVRDASCEAVQAASEDQGSVCTAEMIAVDFGSRSPIPLPDKLTLGGAPSPPLLDFESSVTSSKGGFVGTGMPLWWFLPLITGFLFTCFLVWATATAEGIPPSLRVIGSTLLGSNATVLNAQWAIYVLVRPLLPVHDSPDKS